GGKDVLTGGTGADTFVYISLKDSGPTSATRDTILDFEGAGVPGGDLIDLSLINVKLGGVIFFQVTNVEFVGGGTWGCMRAIWRGDQTTVQIDKDGDMDADF